MPPDVKDDEKKPDQDAPLTAEQEADAARIEEEAMSGQFNELRGIDEKPAVDETIKPEDAQAAAGGDPAPAGTEAEAPAAAAAAADDDQGEQRKPKKAKQPKTVEDRLRNIEGHIGGLNDRLTQLATAATATRDEGQAAPTQEQLEAANASKKRMDDLKEEFPEWAAALEESDRSLRTELEGVKKGQLTAEDLDHHARLVRIDERYEEQDRDWRKDVNTAEYREWIEAQPAEIQALAHSTRLKDSYRLLDAFYARDEDGADDNEPEDPPPPPANQRLRNAVPATKGGSPANRRAQAPTEQEAFESEFNRLRGQRL